jgi:hypothetical protein
MYSEQVHNAMQEFTCKNFEPVTEGVAKGMKKGVGYK